VAAPPAAVPWPADSLPARRRARRAHEGPLAQPRGRGAGGAHAPGVPDHRRAARAVRGRGRGCDGCARARDAEQPGELAKELARALADARAGASLVDAFEGIARRTNIAPLARFVDGIAIAVERGTPLAEVLRAQAVDVREVGKRALLEAGGRKEIAMMVPVVFLVLPVTVVFAMFPAYLGFSFST
jgi:Flp pilus assembly protein TadB